MIVRRRLHSCRYIAIVHPIHAHIICCRRRILAVLAVIWPLSLLCGLPTLLYNTLRRPPRHDVQLCVLVLTGSLQRPAALPITHVNSLKVVYLRSPYCYVDNKYTYCTVLYVIRRTQLLSCWLQCRPLVSDSRKNTHRPMLNKVKTDPRFTSGSTPKINHF